MQDIPMFTGKSGMSGTRRLLELMGHPELGFRMIHVAGTNGKGSTCAFLESIFRGMGLRTGLFTSPHLIRINERMRVMGHDITDDDFLEAFCGVRPAVLELLDEGGQPPSYFEYLFAMSLYWFGKEGIDLLICETGMGGRLDATNSIDRAEAVVITSISLDHTKYLGNSVPEIAFEKAGIIRPHTPVIYWAEDEESAEVIAGRAEELEAEPFPLKAEALHITGREPGEIGLRLALPGREPFDLRIPFGADYQAENASLAALCALTLGADVEDVKSGIRCTSWPGRMQEIRDGVFIDGAHNPDGIRKLACQIRHMAEKRRVWLMAAIVSDKDHGMMARELCRGINYAGVIVTSVGGGRQLPVDVLAEEFRSAGQSMVEAEPDPVRAYETALRKRGGDILVCAGSLYLAGGILDYEKQHKAGREISNAEL